MEMENVEEFIIEEKESDTKETEKKTRPIIRNPVDLQRLKLEKLMKNPDKPILLPEPQKEKDFMLSVPTFVRNVMGSSAGAGSGEFHVYRHLRRKEYARQKYIQAKSIREQLDDDYRAKLEKNKEEAEARTAKKRAKRLKKKEKMKQRGKKPKMDKPKSPDISEGESEESKDECEDEDVVKQSQDNIESKGQSENSEVDTNIPNSENIAANVEKEDLVSGQSNESNKQPNSTNSNNEEEGDLNELTTKNVDEIANGNADKSNIDSNTKSDEEEDETRRDVEKGIADENVENECKSMEESNEQVKAKDGI